ncbi:hypothetical protein NQ318_013501 [Aromia moschata]|uniref:Uncharacterized protein n=1 Tax=Aromia moschata TaxID=1265417 RepID=A0AAV8YD15_9CUCU|nr:hypothetical protein NQ318_013501 [Aromia moschata]
MWTILNSDIEVALDEQFGGITFTISRNGQKDHSVHFAMYEVIEQLFVNIGYGVCAKRGSM